MIRSRTLIGFIGVAYFLAASLCHAGAKKIVLVTAFEPFGGSDANGSQFVANDLLALHQSTKKNVEIHVCILPVVYDDAAAAAEKCFKSLPQKPAMVVSLGEAACDLIRLETIPHNLDETPAPDNAGNLRMGQIILADKADLGFRSPVQNMYCSISPVDREAVMVSASPGNFVCNNTAFHLADYFSAKNIPYNFIHVQNSKCSNLDPARAARIVSEMINNTLMYNERIWNDSPSAPHLKNCVRLPASIDDLANDALHLSQDSCSWDFFMRMKDSMIENGIQ